MDKRIKRYRELNDIPQDISIKQYCLNNIDEIISNLQTIKDKISNNIHLENEDWTIVANLLQNVITPLGNHWYLNN
jgi:hypothetical protein